MASRWQLLQLVMRFPAQLVIFGVRCYQWVVSPWLGNNCRFHPSCSQYFVLAVQKYGALRGSCKGMIRICRCHPWNPGGEDWP
ncbi:MAG: membrane protein insertion efficiency factor YidD [Pirellulaceae bacterium]|nr:membrane protein insertion efficiency factor YidD [Planctomycetaceae bacterium]HIM27961.1 membrane protein insertion efficiency factor YidD [Planctomycetota bacterium]